MSRVTRGNNGITQKYNILTHKGVDIGHHNNSDDDILAHSDGVVVSLVKNYNKTDKTGHSYGNYIKLKHDNGYYTLYAHLKYGSIKLKKGDKVKQGVQIAEMGNTGRSNGKHLHFEVRNEKDKRINPTKYIYEDLPNTNKVYEYQTYDNVKNKWLPIVKSGTSDYAGNLGHGISGLKINKLKYRVHDRVKNKWLPYVTGNKSYAGNLPNNIDGVEIPVTFEIHTIGGKWEKVTTGQILKDKAIDGIRLL